jgi:hypothetical protein
MAGGYGFFIHNYRFFLGLARGRKSNNFDTVPGENKNYLICHG